ncbi:MAG: DedA family protein [Myxococcales bacterium]|nr:DedA family protein [Myxococcales bacterium]USN49825.1 MAG: DedA family protein [Myxococcales bacterium]
MPDQLLKVITLINDLPSYIRAVFLALSVMLEYIFPIFPGDTVVIACGFFALYGTFSVGEIIFSISLGTITGITLAFGFGKLISKNKFPKKYLKYFSQRKVEQIKLWYQKWGYGLLLINRFFPGIRTLFFVTAGMSGLSYFWVLLCGFFSAFIFNSLLFFLGNSLAQNLDIITSTVQNYLNFFYLLSVVVVTILLLKFFSKKTK